MNSMHSIRVMIVDDHLMVRDGLKVFLSTYDDIEVVAEGRDGAQAIELCSQTQPDVVLMDIVMPGLDGPTTTERIKELYPLIQVIALTSFTDQEYVQRALEAGAISYLMKDVHADRLAQAIRDAYKGRGSIDAAAAQALVGSRNEGLHPGDDLTEREMEILAELVAGKSNKEIAAQLSISLGTVRFHVSNILSKLGVSNRTEAVSMALRHGLVEEI